MSSRKLYGAVLLLLAVGLGGLCQRYPTVGGLPVYLLLPYVYVTTDASPGWNRAVEVRIQAVGYGIGIESVCYTLRNLLTGAAPATVEVKPPELELDQGGQVATHVFRVTRDGVYELECWAVNEFDLEGPHVTAEFRVDATPPTVTYDVSPRPNRAGWHRTAVTVTVKSSDAASGVEVVYYRLDGRTGTLKPGRDTLRVSGDGTHELLLWARDAAGNESAKESLTLRVDTTPPTIGAELEPRPNAYGWNNTEVKVHFRCRDALSGVASCQGDTTLTGEGRGQAVRGVATDYAGNSVTKEARVNIDMTPPRIEISPAEGRHIGESLEISWRATDGLSGIESCEVYADGRRVSTSATGSHGLGRGKHEVVVRARDRAGNTWERRAEYEVLAPAYFEIESVAVSPPSPIAGRPAHIEVKIRNTGDVGGRQRVTLSIDGSAVGSQEITIQGGSTESVRFEYRFSAGRHRIRVTTRDDHFSTTVNVLRPVYFAVRDLRASPSPAYVGDTVHIEARIENTGDVSGEQVIRLYIGNHVDSRTVSLAPHSDTSVSFTYIFSNPGRYKLVVRSSDEARYTYIEVRRPPELETSANRIDFGEVKAGSSVTESFWVYNRGGGVLEGTISCSSGNCDVFEVSPSSFSLRADGSQEIKVTFNPRDEGHYWARLEIRSNGGEALVELEGVVRKRHEPIMPGEERLFRRTGIPRIGLMAVRDVASIQELIERADRGETIVLPPGIYQGHLLIKGKQDLVIEGTHTVLIGDDGIPSLEICNSHSITIKGLRLNQGYTGLRISDSSNITIKDCEIAGNSYTGVWIGWSNVRFTGNKVIGNGCRGIVIAYSKDAVIEGNFIAHNKVLGLIIFGSRGSVVIRNNTFVSNEPASFWSYTWGRGLEVHNAKVLLAGNTIEGHADVGALLVDVDATIIGNIVRDTEGNFGRGIELQDSKAYLMGNTIVGSEDIGLALFDSSVELEGDNVIEGNGLNIFVSEGSELVQLARNILMR